MTITLPSEPLLPNYQIHTSILRRLICWVIKICFQREILVKELTRMMKINLVGGDCIPLVLCSFFLIFVCMYDLLPIFCK